MSTFTKEQLIAAACSRIDFAKQMLRGNPLPLAKRKWEIELSLSEIALASLEAEPVGYFGRFEADDEELIDQCSPSINGAFPLYATPPAPEKADPVAWLWSHRKHPSEVTLVRPEDDERADGAHWSGWSCQALYAAPPAPAAMKDHQIRELVNELRDIAVEYHGTEQLRERIARTIRAAMLQGGDGNSPVIPDWQTQAEKMAELYGSSFVLFRNGESPQCADPTKVIISFTDDGLGHGSAAPQQEAK